MTHDSTGAAGDSPAGPPPSGGALDRCLACGADVFGDRYWGRAPLLTRAAELRHGAAGGFTDLLDASAVDELVSRRGLRTPFLRMAQDGAVLPASRFTRGGGAGASVGDQAADDRVLAAMADGATLVLQALHRTWPPLVEFGSRLASELGHPVQINSYVTPPQNRGFAPHYDVHDVFVLQVSGRKRWRIHDPVLTDPLSEQQWEGRRDEVAARARDHEPVIDTVLEPGDALYLPRGTIHAADALGETSIHLTVGVHPVTRYQLLRHLIEAAQEDPALRSSLPMGGDLSDPAILGPELEATLSALRAHLDTDRVGTVARRLGNRLMRDTRPAPISPLAQLDAVAALDDHTVVRLRPGLRVRVESGADGLTLTHLNRTLSLDVDAGEAVKVLLTGAPIAVGELPGPGPEARLDVVATLLREGVLVPG